MFSLRICVCRQKNAYIDAVKQFCPACMLAGMFDDHPKTSARNFNKHMYNAGYAIQMTPRINQINFSTIPQCSDNIGVKCV